MKLEKREIEILRDLVEKEVNKLEKVEKQGIPIRGNVNDRLGDLLPVLMKQMSSIE